MSPNHPCRTAQHRVILPWMAVVTALMAATVLPPPARAMTEEESLGYFRELAETRNFTLGRPVSPKVTADGKFVLFLRAGPRDPTLRLYELDLSSQKERELLTPSQLLGNAEEKLSAEEKARRERQRQTLRGFTSFQLSRDASRLLVTLSGKLYLVNRASLAVTELPGLGWIDPRFSPDGHFAAAVGPDRELHLIDLESTTERPVTHGATATLSHGLAEFVAQEEMSRSQGYWWSPDSATLLCQETDESKVQVRYIADPLHPEMEPSRFFYPHAGSPNAVVRLFLTPRAGERRLNVTWDNEAFPYLAGVNWPEHGPLTILVQNREQTDERLLAIDPLTGTTRELLRETESAWLNLDDNFSGSTGQNRPPLWLKDGRRFLWTTERRGAWQVELRGERGELIRELTPAEWAYRGLVGVDEESESVFATGSNDPRDVQVWRFSLSGGQGVALTSAHGVNAAAFFAPSRILIRTEDAFDGQYRCDVMRVADMHVIAGLRSVAETPKPPLHFPDTQLDRIEGKHPFDVAITRPTEWSRGNKQTERKYPVILNVYAGPTAKMVTANARSFLPDQWLADQGYMVVRIDGRGTPGHGRDWERAIKGNLIDVALADQIDGLRTLAEKYPELDLSRVGVTGWSFGGYFAAMATLRRPDVFRCGIAGAPVVTWENYDTHYTERYLGLPQQSPEAYRVSDVTTYAAQLSRPLLLIHGLTDDNVYFQHTLQLANALYLAGKNYEFMPMLGTHLVSDPMVRLREQQRVISFFDRELKTR